MEMTRAEQVVDEFLAQHSDVAEVLRSGDREASQAALDAHPELMKAWVTAIAADFWMDKPPRIVGPDLFTVAGVMIPNAIAFPAGESGGPHRVGARYATVGQLEASVKLHDSRGPGWRSAVTMSAAELANIIAAAGGDRSKKLWELRDADPLKDNISAAELAEIFKAEDGDEDLRH